MPARIDHPAVREQVRLLYIANGRNLTLAAKTVGVPIDRAEKWKERSKVPWDSPQPESKQIVLSESVGRVANNLANEVESNRNESKLNLSRYVAKASLEALEARRALPISRRVKDVADIHGTLWPERENRTSILNLAIVTGGYQPPDAKSDAIDVSPS